MDHKQCKMQCRSTAHLRLLNCRVEYRTSHDLEKVKTSETPATSADYAVFFTKIIEKEGASHVVKNVILQVASSCVP